MSFMIRMVKSVTVTDLTGKVVQRLEVGDIREATYDAGTHWVSCPSVYKDEAVRLEDPIDDRYIQRSNN